MSVKKYKIKLSNVNKHLKIPIEIDFNSVDQSEVINKDFVEGEVEKSINPIIDYEQMRFTPRFNSGENINKITYKISFLNNDNVLSIPTNYSEIGFVNDDIRFKKNNFKKSFLTLKFYDSDILTNQNLVSIITIYSKVKNNDINLLNAVNLMLTEFTLDNPILEPRGTSEGFYIYYYKDLFDDGKPIELYMRAEFNNAKTGKNTKFITTIDTLPINEMIKKMHVKYLLLRDEGKFYYEIDKNYNNANNIIEVGETVTIKLYEIKVL